jgi:hypothetical protein
VLRASFSVRPRILNRSTTRAGPSTGEATRSAIPRRSFCRDSAMTVNDGAGIVIVAVSYDAVADGAGRRDAPDYSVAACMSRCPG